MSEQPFELLVVEAAIHATVIRIHRRRCLRCRLPFVACSDEMKMLARFDITINAIEEQVPGFIAKAATLEAQDVGRAELQS